MCGFAGFWTGIATSADEMRATVARMSGTLVHRGPDDSGDCIDADAGLALGFRRLAIRDLSPAGHQPMQSASGRHVIVFNGEVYNAEEMRDELAKRGATFRGHSDTEVMLAAIEAWGIDAAVRRFVGMFAFAVWDRTERTLTLARDRMGEKPLYYGVHGGTLLFGSELKALRAHPAFLAEVDRGVLSLFLRHSAVPSPYSIYKGIRQLPPAGMVRITRPAAEPPQPQPYWSLREHIERGARDPYSGPDSEAVDRLESLLRDAVRLQMVADVPLGAFLSGGVDSSTIVALMQAQSTRPVKTFSIGFEEDGFDEAPFAAAVAKRLHTEHTELYVTAAETRAAIPRMPEIYDEPFADPSQIPTYILSELTRKSVTVSLSGDAGDELFAGYDRYSEVARLWSKIGRIPASLRRALAGGMSILGSGSKLARRLAHLSDIFRVSGPEALYLRMFSHWKDPASVVIGGTEPPTIFTDPARWPEACTLTRRMPYLDSMSYLPDDIFTKVDRASMAVSLETRVPMADHRVVEFAAGIPHSLKERQGRRKWILREVLYRYVPPSLIERPKAGFSVPLDGWLRGPLREWAESLLDESRLRREGFFHPAPVRKKWTEHLAGRGHWHYYLWDVLMFQAWHARWN